MKGLRGLMVLSVALLFGCAEFKTLEELELAAFESGDWSAVEKRERVLEKRRARQVASCPSDWIAVCENRGGDERCHCSSRESVQRLLNNL